MNVKNTFGVIGEVLTRIGGVLTGLISVGILSQVVFGTAWVVGDIVGNITTLVNSFLGAGVTGLLVLIILLSLWDSK